MTPKVLRRLVLVFTRLGRKRRPCALEMLAAEAQATTKGYTRVKCRKTGKEILQSVVTWTTPRPAIDEQHLSPARPTEVVLDSTSTIGRLTRMTAQHDLRSFLDSQ